MHGVLQVLVLMVASSASFLTPISYQTNLMVMQPGAYAFLDFARCAHMSCVIFKPCMTEIYLNFQCAHDASAMVIAA